MSNMIIMEEECAHLKDALDRMEKLRGEERTGRIRAEKRILEMTQKRESIVSEGPVERLPTFEFSPVGYIRSCYPARLF